MGMRQQIAYSYFKILRMITSMPWYVTNQTLHDDLKAPFIKDAIQEKSKKPSRQTGKP
jgi:hypothetical protein